MQIKIVTAKVMKRLRRMSSYMAGKLPSPILNEQLRKDSPNLSKNPFHKT